MSCIRVWYPSKVIQYELYESVVPFMGQEGEGGDAIR